MYNYICHDKYMKIVNNLSLNSYDFVVNRNHKVGYTKSIMLHFLRGELFDIRMFKIAVSL